MSMGFIVAEDDPIVWRGLMVHQHQNDPFIHSHFLCSVWICLFVCVFVVVVAIHKGDEGHRAACAADGMG